MTQTTNAKPRLAQLDGFRFLAALWLVIAHNYDESSPQGGLYERFCLRRYVAVQFFLLLSGFVSQYAYGDRDFSAPGVLRKFYVGRFGSILACYYASMAASCIIRGAAGHYSAAYWAAGIPLSLLILQCWVPRYAYFGNTPAWTMSTLAAHWAAFPFLQPRLKRVSDRALFFLAAAMPLIALVPVFALLAIQSGQVSRRQWFALYTHPILRFWDFLCGATLAEIFVRGYRPPSLAIASDFALPAVFALILSVPFESRASPFDSIMIFAPMHLFGLLVYGSSCGESWIGRFSALTPCRKLGDFAFQVYLWRWPLFSCVYWFVHGELQRGYNALSLPYFVPSFIVLYCFSYAWFLYVDQPLRLYLAERTKPTNGDMGTGLIEDDKRAPVGSAGESHQQAVVSSSAPSSQSTPTPAADQIKGGDHEIV